MWDSLSLLFAPSKLGYDKKIVTERSLQERVRLAWATDPKVLRFLLRKYGVSYQIDSFGDMMKFVAFLDKPLAEVLDEMKVPRERITHEFIEFEGPLPYDPNRISIRRIVPGLIEQPKGFAVQPMFKHVVDLPIMAPLDISGLRPLVGVEAWKEVSKIANELNDSLKE
jgi:hypothetical protein